MTGQVYFVEAAGRIKIGSSRHRSVRVRTIEAEVGIPLTLLGEIPGAQPMERAIHRHLSAHRLDGEWFTDCPDVRNEIEKIILDGTFSVPDDPDEWLFITAFRLFGVDAGRRLHELTGHPLSSCYAYVAENPAKRRRPPEHFIRKICHLHEGFYLAFMQDCAAPWWRVRERDRAVALIFRNAIEQARTE